MRLRLRFFDVPLVGAGVSGLPLSGNSSLLSSSRARRRPLATNSVSIAIAAYRSLAQSIDNRSGISLLRTSFFNGTGSDSEIGEIAPLDSQTKPEDRRCWALQTCSLLRQLCGGERCVKKNGLRERIRGGWGVRRYSWGKLRQCQSEPALYYARKKVNDGWEDGCGWMTVGVKSAHRTCRASLHRHIVGTSTWTTHEADDDEASQWRGLASREGKIADTRRRG